MIPSDVVHRLQTFLVEQTVFAHASVRSTREKLDKGLDPVHQVKGFEPIVGDISKVNVYALGTLVDVAHHGHLKALLGLVSLVDADTICPYILCFASPPWSLASDKVASEPAIAIESLRQAFMDEELLTIHEDLPQLMRRRWLMLKSGCSYRLPAVGQRVVGRCWRAVSSIYGHRDELAIKNVGQKDRGLDLEQVDAPRAIIDKRHRVIREVGQRLVNCDRLCSVRDVGLSAIRHAEKVIEAWKKMVALARSCEIHALHHIDIGTDARKVEVFTAVVLKQGGADNDGVLCSFDNRKSLVFALSVTPLVDFVG